MTERPLDISPATRIAPLLDAYPELEEVLIATAPAFVKLKNPILRRTVAKLATVEQAAGIAGLEVRALVRTLREAVGMEAEPAGGEAVDRPAEGAPTPAWATSGDVVAVFDADAMLARGEVPLAPAMRRARELQEGELLRIDVSFRPTPLLDKLTEAGHPVHVAPTEGPGFAVFVGAR